MCSCAESERTAGVVLVATICKLAQGRERKNFMHAKAVPILLRIMNDPSILANVHACQALKSLADTLDHQAIIAHAGVLPPLIRLLQDSLFADGCNAIKSHGILQAAMSLLRALLGNKNTHVIALKVEPQLHALLTKIIAVGTDQCKQDAAHAQHVLLLHLKTT